MSNVSLTAFISYRIDKYHERIKQLEAVINDKDRKLQKLDESLNKRKYILKDIEIVINSPLDEISKLSLKKHIADKYSSIVGKEIKYIDAELLEEIIDNRIMKLGEREFRIKFNKLVVSEVMKLWITADIIE
ncbi:MAG: hypothetical protein ACOZCL_16180 [Bacillota bacterium]